MEPRTLLFLPAWIKVLAIGLLAVLLGASGYLLWWHSFAVPDRDIVNAAVSLLQVAATGLLLLIAVAFSERDANVQVLMRRNEQWLTKLLPQALGGIGAPIGGTPYARQSDDTPMIVTVRPGRNRVIADFTVMPQGSPHLQLSISVFLNVRKISVFAYVPFDDKQSFEMLEKALAFTLDGARTVGYTGIIQKADSAFDQGNRLVIALYVDVGADFLSRPTDGLYWAQDVALFVRSMIFQAWRSEIILNHAVLSGEQK